VHKKKKVIKKRVHDLSGVGSIGIKCEGVLDENRFNLFMRNLLRSKSKDLYRSKGIITIEGQDRVKWIFQGVHEQMNFGPANEKWNEGEKIVNKMVFIGRNLEKDMLEEQFKNCIHVPLPDGYKEHFDPKTCRFYYETPEGGTSWVRPTAAKPSEE